MNPKNASIVRLALLANAALSTTTGALALTLHRPLSQHLGLSPGPWIPAIGAGLLLFAGLLLWSVRRGPTRQDLVAFVLGDWAWVLGSMALVLLAPDLLSADGRVLVSLLAVPVAVLGSLQALGLAPERRALEG